MAQEFQPSDFEPLYDQTLILTSSLAATPSDLSALLPDLNSIHRHLSTLIEKATNRNSLLRIRCADRHGEWLQIQYDLQDTLCETQDLLNSLAEPDDKAAIDVDAEYAKLVKAQEELGTHSFLIAEFIDSLGLSKVARKDGALGEIERILIEAAREEREGYTGEIEEEVPEINRLGGRYGVNRLLQKNGVDRSEISRLDTKIKQIVFWVLKNEPDLTMIRDLEGFGEEKKGKAAGEGWSRVVEPPKPLKVQRKLDLDKHYAWRPKEGKKMGSGAEQSRAVEEEVNQTELGDSPPYEAVRDNPTHATGIEEPNKTKGKEKDDASVSEDQYEAIENEEDEDDLDDFVWVDHDRTKFPESDRNN